tara:strand:+ start:12513 stop:12653 length:141 start_codon:yes stop_codon:yes gene_type:complete
MTFPAVDIKDILTMLKQQIPVHYDVADYIRYRQVDKFLPGVLNGTL